MQGGIEKRVIENYEGGIRKLLIQDSSAHIVLRNSEGLKKWLKKGEYELLKMLSLHYSVVYMHFYK